MRTLNQCLNQLQEQQDTQSLLGVWQLLGTGAQAASRSVTASTLCPPPSGPIFCMAVRPKATYPELPVVLYGSSSVDVCRVGCMTIKCNPGLQVVGCLFTWQDYNQRLGCWALNRIQRPPTVAVTAAAACSHAPRAEARPLSSWVDQ